MAAFTGQKYAMRGCDNYLGFVYLASIVMYLRILG